MDGVKSVNSIRQRLVAGWTSSFLFRWIDGAVSRGYRRRLKNDGFTILCSNCIGGIIYHRLGKQFLSPTINLFFKQPDFVSFCVHLDYYLEKELVFVDDNCGYPVANLEGNGRDIPTITIYFNHDKENAAAREKWEKRKKRIRRDNLFIMLYNLDGVTVDQLHEIEKVKCRNKVVFTATPLPEIPWSICIQPNLRHQFPYSYLQKNFFGVRYFEHKFDAVDFLNCGTEGNR